jgi:hypothetical protein
MFRLVLGGFHISDRTINFDSHKNEKKIGLVIKKKLKFLYLSQFSDYHQNAKLLIFTFNHMKYFL